jgi:pimeloyl-ACP methyl ester carboxylesterase
VAPYVGRDGLNHFLTLAKSVEEEDLSWIEPRGVQQPTLVLHGDADRWCSASDAAELAATLARGSAETVSGSGRLIPEEQPEVLGQRIVAHARATEPEGLAQAP